MNQLVTKIDKGEVTRLCADAISELERAARLHPEWPTKLHSVEDPRFDEDILSHNRSLNDLGYACGESIFTEEFTEFLVAAREPGNHVAARIELVQTMAMLLRIGCHLGDYVPKAETGNSKLETGEVQP